MPTSELPVCCKCNEIIPELEIYYTLDENNEPSEDGKDYCQYCAFDILKDNNMTTHTPWNASNNFVYADGYKIVIAECDTHQTALLIAAAPEMLEMLEKIEIWLISPDLSKDIISQLHDLTIDVIAKAKGES
jgi:hypothetical protein